MKRLVLAVVLAVAVAVFGSVSIVAGPDNEAPYSSHVDPLGEGGSYVPKADGPDNYPNYEKACLDIENIILVCAPVGEDGSYVPKADGPGEGGSYVPKVAMEETDSSSNSSSSSGSEATGGISG